MPVVKDHRGDIATDPLRNFKFIVRLKHKDNSIRDGFMKMGFMSVAGLSMATEVIPYREGGNNTSTRKMPGQTNYSDITLTAGVIIGRGALWEWAKKIFYVIQGKGGSGPGTEFRSRMSIHVMGHPINDRKDQPTRAIFDVFNCWPSSIAFSDLDAGGNAILVHQMVLAHEGWKFHLANKLTGDGGNVADKDGIDD